MRLRYLPKSRLNHECAKHLSKTFDNMAKEASPQILNVFADYTPIFHDIQGSAAFKSARMDVLELFKSLSSSVALALAASLGELEGGSLELVEGFEPVLVDALVEGVVGLLFGRGLSVSGGSRDGVVAGVAESKSNEYSSENMPSIPSLHEIENSWVFSGLYFFGRRS